MFALCVLVACTTSDDDGAPRRTGEQASLPPPPAGGFDPAVTVDIEGVRPLRAEVARRPDQRQRGLMQRRAVPDGTGMLFLFPRRTSGGFHMLGTLVPLSIAFVDAGRVVGTSEMRPCAGPPCPVYGAPAPYTAAVEAAAGYFRRVEIGARVTVVGPTRPPE